MTVLQFVFNLVIGPLKLLFETIFSMANRVVNPGFSIVALSLAMNLLVLPLYRRADVIQAKEQKAQKQMASWTKHIRSYFSGDEQFMILQTYYRQNHYSQIGALKGALPLLLEIPFFIAAYQFLSGLTLLQGASFGWIRDLGKPDALFQTDGFVVNVLPVLMTVINLISSEIYTRGASLKSKMQLWVMALVFLFFLYDSPSGLVLYWTLNNLFSLIKNIVTKILSSRERTDRKQKIPHFFQGSPAPSFFFLAASMMALLTGLLIPSAVLVSSPTEFVDSKLLYDPMGYIFSAFSLATGTFILWAGVYYALGSRSMKKVMEWGMWLIAGMSLVNYMGFRVDAGSLSSLLKYDREVQFSTDTKLLNLGVLALLCVVMSILCHYRGRWAAALCVTGVLTIAVMGVANLVQAEPSISRTLEEKTLRKGERLTIPLSKVGHNVIVMMLDRAEGLLMPSILAEKPELADVFDGFVYYPNTLSHGAHTNLGAPGLFGGYEYVPSEMNRRDTELIMDKHNEALQLMPTLFSRAGYQVTVCDLPDAGEYMLEPDISLYSHLEHTNAYVTEGIFNPDFDRERFHTSLLRNFFCYSLCEISPVGLYGTLYNMGLYNQPGESGRRLVQTRENVSQAQGTEFYFMNAYSTLKNLPEVTMLTEDEKGTFLSMVNYVTHDPMLLSEPEYEPTESVDNLIFDAEHRERFLVGRFPLVMKTDYQMSHYHANMAAMIQIGNWLTYLKELGVYDRTRIILAGDHGIWQMDQGERTQLPGVPNEQITAYNPLLLVKDFDSHGKMKTDETFMTNADVPTLAMRGVITNPINPFTGKAVPGEEMKESPQMVSLCHSTISGVSAGTTFPEAGWYAVQGDIYDQKSWEEVGSR